MAIDGGNPPWRGYHHHRYVCWVENGVLQLNVTLPHHRVLRTSTRRRMKRRIGERHALYCRGETSAESLNQCFQSYLGMMSHAEAYDLAWEVKNVFCWR